MDLHDLHSTDELIAAYRIDPPERPNWYDEALEKVIPAAIDTLYRARDTGLMMPAAGAAVAVRVLELLGEIGAFER